MTIPTGPTDPAERGSLDIDPTVLRKIVEHAADQVPGTVRLERRLAGIEMGESGARARVTTGNGDPLAVDVRLDVSLQYPAEIRVVVNAVRRRIGEELTRITGQHLREFTVNVGALRAPQTHHAPTARVQ